MQPEEAITTEELPVIIQMQPEEATTTEELPVIMKTPSNTSRSVTNKSRSFINQNYQLQYKCNQ
ncbi:MAG: hypothetical protein U1E31_02105 [Rickettsiales bacterium]